MNIQFIKKEFTFGYIGTHIPSKGINILIEAFKNINFIKDQSGDIEGHAYHLYIIEVENRLGLYNFLRENNIFTQIHYIPCHLMPYYRNLGWKDGDRLHSEKYYKKCISLPMYPSLTDKEQKFVIYKILEFYNL